MDYLKYIPKGLLEDLKNQKVIPFVGAGFSKNAQFPDGNDIPDWNELGRKISEELDGYTYERGMALDALSTYEDLYSRVKLIETLSKYLMIKGMEPGKTHEAFCKLFNGIVCTTNFDDLLEKAYSKVGRPVSVIASEDKLSLNLEKYTKVIKIHGDFNHLDNMVISEKDYDCYIGEHGLMATYISSLFITNTILLVGYSFDDYDIRTLWGIINGRLGKLKRTGYCILVDASAADILRFKRRNIRVINIPGDKKDYQSILQDVFEQIQESIDSKSVSALKATDARIKENMLIKEDERNRLCYISAPFEVMTTLRESLFPLINQLGYEPTFSNEVLSFGDNEFRKIELLIKRCGVMIVDISRRNPYTEWEIITAKNENKKVVYIQNTNANDPFFVNDEVIEYESLYDIKFVSAVEKKLKPKRGKTDLEVAEDLLSKKDYMSSVILALRYLEEAMRKKADVKAIPQYRQSLAMMLRKKANDGFITREEVDIVINIRNEIVHTKREVTKKEAEYVISFVKKCIEHK